MKNIKIRFYLEPKRKEPENRNQPELIMSEIGYGYYELNKGGLKRYKPLRFSLQESILPSKFGLKELNYKFDERIFKKSTSNNSTIKTKILRLETALTEISTTFYTFSKLPTPLELKEELIKKLRIEENLLPKISILDFLYSKIDSDKENSSKSKRNSKRKNTIKTYTTLSHQIENYQIATKEILHFENFDEKSYWKFWDILDDVLSDKIQIKNTNQPRKQRKQSYGYLVASLRKYQKALIITLKEAKKEGHTTPLDLYDKNLILEDADASKEFYLESDILEKVIKSDFSKNVKMQNARDYLIIACLTGMRYESMKNAEDAEIKTYKDSSYNFRYIHSIQNKTSTEVFIPLLKPINVIINTRGFPKISANSKINADLKKLFQILKINRIEKLTKVTYKNGTIETEVPLSNLISTHDCKGTFYSNLSTLKVSESAIDNITHPDKKPKNAMGKIYNKTTMLTKAKLFVDEINKVECNVHSF